MGICLCLLWLHAVVSPCRRRAAGRGEATVYRDKETGAIISADEYAEQVSWVGCQLLGSKPR